MENLIPGNEIPLADFAQLSASFLITMIVILSADGRKHNGLTRFLPGTFTVLWITIFTFHKPLATKLFATLLMVTVIVAIVVKRKRRLEVR